MRKSAAIGLVLALPVVAAAEPAAPITKIETRSLPADEVSKRVMDQLSRIIMPSPDSNARPHPKMPLSELSFWTKARATLVTGICAADGMTISFRRAGAEAGADTPVEASGVVAKTFYHFIDWPKDLKRHDQSAKEAAFDEAHCAHVDPEHVQMIAAPDETDAAEGAWLLGEIARRSGDTNDVLAPDCTRSLPYTLKQCRQLLAPLRRDEIGWIERCETAATENQEDQCIKIGINKPQLELRVLFNGDYRIDDVGVSYIMMSRDPIPD